jgi:hypothetical protein
MRVERTTSLGSLLLSCSLLALGACGDDDGTAEGSAGTTTGGLTDTTAGMTTEQESVDTTAGPMPTTEGPTTDPTVGLDTTDGETTTGEPPSELDAFRFVSMEIRDPHFFDTLICSDITGMVNSQFAGALSMDGSDPPDGLLDLSLTLVFRPANQADGAVGDMDFANADCTAPAETTECSLREGTMLYSSSFVNMADGTCHAADPAHLGGYNPPPGTTTGPCFASSATDVVIVTAFDLPLNDAIIAAQYSGDDNLVSGTIRGFLTAADAAAITLPNDLPVVGGSPISALLKGGMGGSVLCNGDDRDGDGWWFYVDFTAERVPWTE